MRQNAFFVPIELGSAPDRIYAGPLLQSDRGVVRPSRLDLRVAFRFVPV